MKINRILRYNGNAITREYKKNKHLTYFNAAAVGTFLGSANVCTTIGEIGKSALLGSIGLLFLTKGLGTFSNLLKMSKPYEAICQRAKKIYKNN